MPSYPSWMKEALDEADAAAADYEVFQWRRQQQKKSQPPLPDNAEAATAKLRTHLKDHSPLIIRRSL
jgi:hypothetical protein